MVTKQQILAALEGTKLPCVRITPDGDRTPGPTDSKFGGDFYLPDGREAPDMEFLAQVNFSQIPPLEGFPDTGLLQFFLRTGDEEFENAIAEESIFTMESGLFQAVYYPEVPADGPAHEDQVPEERWAMAKLLGGMKFTLLEEPATLSLDDEGFLADLGFQDAVDKVLELFKDAYEDEYEEDEEDADGYDLSDCGGVDDLAWDFGNWGVKLGGHPSLRHEDLRLEDEDYGAYSTLLFQFDLTPFAEDGEADTFCFFIKPEDLKSRRFDDILLTWHNCY